MLRITPIKSATGAKKYFEDALAVSDYYLRDQSILAQWAGRGAELLGLNGAVRREDFFALCDNKRPDNQEKLTARDKGNRRVYYDFTFSVPKSASVLAALGSDNDRQALRDAFNEAVRETMERIVEPNMQTRVRAGGKDEDRTVGNALWATFHHEVTRPLADGLPDPHSHQHVVIFNAVYDSVEQKWKAAQFGDLKKHAPLIEAIFDTKLAAKLKTLGYRLERTATGWDIAGLPESTRLKFSRRTEEIEAMAAKLGIVHDSLKSQLGAKTRQRKNELMTQSQLREAWRGRLDAGEADALRRVKDYSGPVIDVSGREAVDYALSHLFARESVITETKLAVQALKYGVGSVTLGDVQKAIAERKDLIRREKHGEVFYTQKTILREELAMVKLARKNRGKYGPLIAGAVGKEESLALLEGYDKLSKEQKSAAKHILTESENGVILLRGKAGVGKTFLLKVIAQAIERYGNKQVYAFAPTSTAARDVLAKEGFKADTVAQLLKSKELQQSIKNNVILIDEAGLMPVKDLKSVLEIADKQKARVILVGDTGQMSPVARGEAMRILEKNAFLPTVEFSNIRRQTGSYKKAIAALAKGDLESGWKLLDAMGAIREVKRDKYRTLARDYVQAVEGGHSTLAVAATHAECNKANHSIRALLKERGLLNASKREFTRLVDLQWTDAQKQTVGHYEPGYVVQFHRSLGSFKAGERVKVEAVAGDRLKTADASGNIRFLPLQATEKFSVYREAVISIAQGDRLLITQNGFAKNAPDEARPNRVNNGTLVEVERFTQDGDIRLKDGRVLGKDFAHYAYGYTTTVHKAQGQSIDKAFLLDTLSTEQFYVGASRGKLSLTVLTSNKEALKQSAMRPAAKMSAIELVKKDEPQKQTRGGRVKIAIDRARLKALAGIFVSRKIEQAKAYAKHWADRTIAPRREQHKDYER